MLRYISADWLFPVCTAPIKNGVIAINQNGVIENVLTQNEAIGIEPGNIKKYRGALVPGFINTHCHLELSHLQGLVAEKTGLVTFVQNIIKNRQGDDQKILEAMQKADHQMLENGIVAVGDVSNQIISKSIKEKSLINYHTFIETMSFNPERASSVMGQAKDLKQQFYPLRASVVPHAPYSVSEALFSLINEYAIQENAFLSIHNQETEQENLFFQNKTGDFLNLYKFLGLDISFFKSTGKTSLQSWLPYMKKQKMLLVHNTVSDQADIDFAVRNHNDLYWCLCPRANLYIENTLPDVDLLMGENVKITLGTDSLASNNQLNILAEMRTLQENKQINFEALLQWATLNGAEFLGIDDYFGTLAKGKKPGLNLIQLSDDFKIKRDVVEKIILN